MRTARCFQIIPLIVSLCLLPPATSAHEPVFARKGMVVAQEPLAADVGIAVLKSGGNAVDAAVAVGFALAVTHPFAGNIGGGGFMLIRLSGGRTGIFDFPEKTPRQAKHNMYFEADGKLTRANLICLPSPGGSGTARVRDPLHQKEC